MRSHPKLSLLMVLAVAAPAGAYRVKKSDLGLPLRWQSAVIPIEIAVDEGGPADTTREPVVAAVVAAFDAWNAVLPMPAHVTATVVRGASPPTDTEDERNVVKWVDQRWDDDYEPEALAVTITTYDSTSGLITDADILLNATRYAWVVSGSSDAPCEGAYDLQNVVAHEAGHLLGLAHAPSDEDATMYPSSDTCETKKRDLDADDLAGLRYLYELSPEPTRDLPAYGCGVAAGRPVGGPLALLVVALLALVPIRRRRLVALAVVVVALCGPAAMATTLRRLAPAGLAAGADVVARGTIVGSTVTVKNGRSYTDAVLAVTDCWKGVCAEKLTVRRLGGEVGGKGMSVEGSAELAVGDEVVLFLRARRDGAFAVVGMAQGSFRVVRDRAGGVSRLVRDASGIRLVQPDGSATDGTLESFAIESVRGALAR